VATIQKPQRAMIPPPMNNSSADGAADRRRRRPSTETARIVIPGITWSVISTRCSTFSLPKALR